MKSELGSAVAKAARIMRRQHACASRDQLIEAGVSPWLITKMVRTGLLDRVFKGIYRTPGSVPTWHQKLMLAQLWGGKEAAVSHRSAGILHGLLGTDGHGLLSTDGGPPTASIEIVCSTPRRSPANWLVVHRRRALEGVVVNQGFRVTNPVKTCIDLAAVLSKKGLSELVDEALRRQLFTIGELRLEMTKGRDGGAAISSLLSERGEWTTESRLEDRVYRFIVRAGLEPPVRQHEVRWRGRVMRLDFAYPQELVAIEADGYRYHSAKSNWESDLKRQNLLADLGWHVIHVTWDDVKKRPRQTLELIGRALTRSGRPSPRPNRRSGRA